jgi:hypothetical protein
MLHLATLLLLQAALPDRFVINHSATRANNKIGVQHTMKWEIAASGDRLVRLRWDEKRNIHIGSMKLGKEFWGRFAALLPATLPADGGCPGTGGCTDPPSPEALCSQHVVTFRVGTREGSIRLCDKKGAALAELYKWIEGVADGVGGRVTALEVLDVYHPEHGGLRKALENADTRLAAMRTLEDFVLDRGGLRLSAALEADKPALFALAKGPIDDLLKSKDEEGQLAALRFVEVFYMAYASREQLERLRPKLDELQAGSAFESVRGRASLRLKLLDAKLRPK